MKIQVSLQRTNCNRKISTLFRSRIWWTVTFCAQWKKQGSNLEHPDEEGKFLLKFWIKYLLHFFRYLISLFPLMQSILTMKILKLSETNYCPNRLQLCYLISTTLTLCEGTNSQCKKRDRSVFEEGYQLNFWKKQKQNTNPTLAKLY